MALTNVEVEDLAGDLFDLGEDLVAVKKRKKAMTEKEIKGFAKRSLKIAAKLTIDILD